MFEAASSDKNSLMFDIFLKIANEVAPTSFIWISNEKTLSNITPGFFTESTKSHTCAFKKDTLNYYFLLNSW